MPAFADNQVVTSTARTITFTRAAQHRLVVRNMSTTAGDRLYFTYTSGGRPVTVAVSGADDTYAVAPGDKVEIGVSGTVSVSIVASVASCAASVYTI